MQTRSRLIAACCVVALAGGGGVTAAAAFHPPAGTPDLSRMAVQITDLAPGARIASEGYFRDSGYVAAYRREFTHAHAGRIAISDLESDVELDESADDATASLFLASLAISDPDTRRELARQLIKTVMTGAPSLRIREVTFGPLRHYRIGTGALVLPMTLRTSIGRIHAVLAFAAIARVEATVVAVAATGHALAPRDVKPLLKALAAHVVTGLSPILVAPPAVTGTVTIGQTLSAAPGAWANRPTAYAYQWQRCDLAGADCASIPGATGQAYNVGLGDVGATLRVVVTARNSVGPSSASSPSTAVAS